MHAHMCNCHRRSRVHNLEQFSLHPQVDSMQVMVRSNQQGKHALCDDEVSLFHNIPLYKVKILLYLVLCRSLSQFVQIILYTTYVPLLCKEV